MCGKRFAELRRQVSFLMGSKQASRRQVIKPFLGSLALGFSGGGD